MLKRPKSHFSLVSSSETWTADLAVGIPEVVIAFMGVTGSGKSSFVKAVTGRDDIVVGDQLKSSKFDLFRVRWLAPDRVVVLKCVLNSHHDRTVLSLPD
jgi:hypothetical protein